MDLEGREEHNVVADKYKWICCSDFVPVGVLGRAPPLHEAPCSCSKMAASAFPFVWCQRSEHREEICAAADAYRLGLERELQRWGLCH